VIFFRVRRSAQFAAAVLFLLALAFACYRHATPNFDRIIYEALVRGKTQPIDDVYNIVKHESPRAEASTILDSPQHLRELEPLYAMRRVYIAAIAVVGRVLPLQNAITFLSAAGLFGLGIVILCWTKRPLLTCLVVSSYPFITMGRFGTPDAFSSLFVVAGLWLLERNRAAGLALLFVSLGIRTDNILLLLAVVAWLAWERQLSKSVAALLAIAGAGVVIALDQWAGNYGWAVLFRFSFIGGRYPAQISHSLSVAEYLGVLARGAAGIVVAVAVWLFMGILAWRNSRNPLLLVTAVAVSAHFLLYPSTEDRYLVWAYAIAATMLIQTVGKTRSDVRPVTAKVLGSLGA